MAVFCMHYMPLTQNTSGNINFASHCCPNFSTSFPGEDEKGKVTTSRQTGYFRIKLNTLEIELVIFKTQLDTFQMTLDTLLSKFDAYEITSSNETILLSHWNRNSPKTTEYFLYKQSMNFVEIFIFRSVKWTPGFNFIKFLSFKDQLGIQIFEAQKGIIFLFLCFHYHLLY